jgi:dynactin-4
MSKAYILYVDHQGHPAPLTECFHATASRRLSSTTEDRFPPSTLTEVDSAYCPQCLSFHDAASAARLLFCSKATCQRCPICVTAVASVSAQDNVCCYQCGQCDWTSRECGLTVPLEGEEISKIELTRAAEELGFELSRRRQQEPTQLLDDYFSNLTGAWDKHSKASRTFLKPVKMGSNKDPQELWSVDTLEASLEDKRKLFYNQDIANDTQVLDESSGLSVQRLSMDETTQVPQLDNSLSTISIHALQWQALPFAVDSRQDLLPLPTNYRVRRSRRCRAELAEGRPGIVLKPKLNPLEGDSSLRTGHGQWWRKVCTRNTKQNVWICVMTLTPEALSILTILLYFLL